MLHFDWLTDGVPRQFKLNKDSFFQRDPALRKMLWIAFVIKTSISNMKTWPATRARLVYMLTEST